TVGQIRDLPARGVLDRGGRRRRTMKGGIYVIFDDDDLAEGEKAAAPGAARSGAGNGDPGKTAGSSGPGDAEEGEPRPCGGILLVPGGESDRSGKGRLVRDLHGEFGGKAVRGIAAGGIRGEAGGKKYHFVRDDAATEVYHEKIGIPRGAVEADAAVNLLRGDESRERLEDTADFLPLLMRRGRNLLCRGGKRQAQGGGE